MLKRRGLINYEPHQISLKIYKAWLVPIYRGII